MFARRGFGGCAHCVPSDVVASCLLNVLTYNLLTALKRLTLPGDFATARLKRLRFLLFNTVGKVVRHARRTLLRLTGAVQLALMRAVRQRIPALAPLSRRLGWYPVLRLRF